MSATQQTAERTALQGLLLLLVEVQNEARQSFAAMQHVRDLVESKHAGEMIQLARAALDAPLFAVTPTSVQRADLRVAWLIERPFEGNRIVNPCVLWRSLTSFTPDAGWTTDANQALQFSRKEDAQAFIDSDAGDGEIYVAEAIEHGFHGDAHAPAPAAIPAAAAGTHE